MEEKIVSHRKDLLRKELGSKKNKRNKRQTDGVSVLSSERFCISTSSNIARALKMPIPKRNPKHYNAFLNRPDLAQFLHFSPPLPIAAPPFQPEIAGLSATQLTPSTKQLTHLLRQEKRTITVSNTSESDTSSVRKSKRSSKSKRNPQNCHGKHTKYRGLLCPNAKF